MKLPIHRYVACCLPVLAFIAAMILPPVDAVAAPAAATTTESQSEYRTALKAMEEKDWGTAQRILLALWSEAHTYDVAASLGQLEYFRKNYAAAARYIAYALANVPPKEDPTLIQRLKTALDELRPHVGAVHVSVNEPSAEIRANGDLVGVSPLALDLFFDPGTYDLEARLGPDRTVHQRLVISAGGTYRVTLELPPETPPPNAAAPVPVASTPASSSPVPAEPVPDSPRSMIPVYIGVGVVSVGTVMAIGFGIAAKTARNEANAFRSELGPDGCTRGVALPSACSVAADAYDRQRRDATLTKVSIGITAVTAVATLTYLLWPKSSTKDSTARAVPQPAVALDRNSGTLLLTGQF